MITIRPAAFPADLDTVRALFREYALTLGIDLGFQDFEQELEGLPGKYAPPAGQLLLAWQGVPQDEEVVGCVAMRRIDEAACEMKRLYLRPGLRGAKLGKQLAQRICEEARAAGYQRICLDTLPDMHAAIRVYTGLGFTPIEPYIYNPIPGAMFMGREL